LAALVLAAAPALAQPQSPPTRSFTARDLNMLDRVSDPRFSPDGRTVLYALRKTDYEANRGVNALWTVDRAGGGAPRRLPASEGGAHTGRWGPDGAIYFLSSRSGSQQVWRTDRDGARATQVTDLPLDVGSFRISPDGKRIALSMAVFPDCGGDEFTCTKRRLDEQGARKASGVAVDTLFIRHWDEWANGTRNHLFVRHLAAAPIKDVRPITPGLDGDVPSRPFGDEADYVFTPDSRDVIYAVRTAGRTEAWSTNFDLWRVSLAEGSRPRNITADNPAWDAAPAVSPDGRQLAWLAMRRPGFEADRFHVMVRDLATGRTREIAPQWDRSPHKVQWSPDGRTLYADAQDIGQTRLFAIDVASGRVTPLTGEGRVVNFDVGAGGVVYSFDDLDSPAQLVAAGPDGRGVRQLTRHNEQLLSSVRMGTFEQFSFPGWNGETVYGYVVRPANFQPGRRYPVAFLIHGGPQGSFGQQFHYRWNAQTYAGAGYAVVMIDFHGSTGYGQAFTDAISGHWGDRPLEDLQKGWAHALRRYPFLDGERACALGGSYGGYMVNWMAGVWNEPWDCFVSHAGVFDNRAMGYMTEELWFTEWENEGLPWERPENYEKFNPVNHVRNWSKPILVTQGNQDFRIPYTQSIGAFTAAQRKGVPSRYVYFPDENHWILKPQNSVQWHEEVQAWLDRWTGPEPRRR
ncbi:MAG TPA: S9 family peptidase, partial [Caulobacteraceae bacterium]